MASSSAAPTPTGYLPAPSGVVPNFVNPPSLALISNVTVGLCLSVVTIFFLSRSYVRLFIKHSWILEDWVVFVSWGGTVAFCAIVAVTMSHHGGEHGWDLTVPEAMEASYWFYIASIEYGPIICITKISVLMLYRRVFIPQRRGLFYITIVTLGTLLTGFYVGLTLAKIFQCSPRARIIDKEVPGTCLDVSMLLNASGLFNTITDFIILFLPVQAVWNLQMKKKNKIMVVLVFTFGLCAPVFSLVGFIVRFQISGNPDTTWNQPELLLWAAAELTTGNLCVCFPELNALLRFRRSDHTNSYLSGSGYRSSDRQRVTNPGSKMVLRRADDEQYFELNDHAYKAKASQSSRSSPSDRSREVQIRQEIVVESHTI